ncbi:MFS transporter [Metabacillus sp. RGM 3146]|uniref:MFS transporter n=1 Tax=Metabacillus sp. RGM 3146 TaxID=3401092 RepID=UPI003B9A44B9
MMELLKDKVYIRYWLAVVISFLGDAMTLTTAVYLVGTLSKDPFMISLVFIAQLLPLVVIGPLIGPVIDRYSRRMMMVLSDLFRFLIVFFMIFSYENMFLLISLIFLQGIGTAVFEPARMASIPSIVGVNRIPQGIALFQSTLAVIKLVGPVLGGVILAFQSPIQIFIFDAFSYFISAILFMGLSVLAKTNEQQFSSELNYLDHLKTGLFELFRKPILRFVLILLVPVMVSIGIFTTNYKAVLLQVFEVGKIEFGLIEGTLAFGTVIGAIAGSYLLKRILHYRLLFLSIGVLGICIVSIHLISSLFSQWTLVLFPLIIWSLLIGVSNAILTVPTSTIFLQEMPEIIRGRGTAIFFSINNLLILIGTLLGGILGKNMGIILTIMISGSLLIITVLFYPIFRRSKLLLRVKDSVSNLLSN